MGADVGSQGFRFGAFELDARTGELRKGGRSIRLAPQPGKLLLLLVSRAGQLVTREEIKTELWGNDTFVNFEHSLNTCMRQIRLALNDDSEAPRYIETLPRRGYRFIMAVEAPSQALLQVEPQAWAGAPPVSISPPKGHTGIQRDVRFRVWSLVLLGVLALGFTLWLGVRRSAIKRSRVMIAVLPLQDLSADATDAYLSSGLTEEIITRLAQIQPEQLGVIARTSSVRYASSSKSVAQIGSELGVDYLLEGSLQHDGNRIRVHAQLIRIGDQSHIWADSYDEDLGDLLNLERDIAGSVTREVARRLTDARRIHAAAVHVNNPQAHQAYLRGRFHLQKLTRAGDEKAVEYFNEAIAADPNYAMAYVGLAEAQIALTTAHRAPLETMPVARAAAEKAISLDESLAEAHATMGTIKLMYDWDWPGAEQEFRRAVALDPNSADAHRGYSQYFAVTGQTDAAVRELRIANTLDPLNETAAWNYYATRRYDDAIRQARSLLELQPTYGWAYSIMAMSYSGLGRHEEAVNAAERGRHLLDTPMVQIAQAVVYANAGRRHAAERLLAQLTAESEKQYVCGVQLATVYAVLGRTDEAFESLERAYLQRSD
jgi:TolB-like protein/DNA-binding winged helix-turn-helix (wHTH) protein/Tfp pilus assembly protein PilF